MLNLIDIHKLALVCTGCNREVVLLQFPGAHGSSKSVTLRSAASPVALARAITDNGGVLPIDRDDRLAMMTELAARPPEASLRLPTRTGWYENQIEFVSTDTVISSGAPVNAAYFPSLPRLSDEARQASLAHWTNKIAKRAGQSRPMMLAIAASLAPAILPIVPAAPFLIDQVAANRDDAGLLLMAASSVTDSAVTWDSATLNRRRVPWNELRDGMPTMISDWTSRTTRGADRLGHTVAGACKCRFKIPGVRSTVFIGTRAAGDAVPAYATAQGMERQAFLPITIPLAGFRVGLFDNLPPNTREEAPQARRERRANIDRNLRAALATLTSRVALDAFAKFLLDNRDGLPDRVSETVGTFASEIEPETGNIPVARAFGVLYATGLLGIEAGLLPWDLEAFGRALKRFYRRAIEHQRSTMPDMVIQGEALLWERLKDPALRMRRCKSKGDIARAETEERVVFYEGPKGRRILWVSSTVARSWFPSTAMFNAVIAKLKRDGVCNDQGNPQERILGRKDNARYLRFEVSARKS